MVRLRSGHKVVFIDNSVLRMTGDRNRVYLKFAAKISSVVSAQSAVSSGSNTTDTYTKIRLVFLLRDLDYYTSHGDTIIAR